MKNKLPFLLLLIFFQYVNAQDYTIGTVYKDGYTTISKNIQIAPSNYYNSGKYEYRYGLINSKTKKNVLPVNYRSIYTSWEDGIYILKDTTDKYSLFNAKTNTFLTENIYSNIDGFNEGIAVVNKRVGDSYEYVYGGIDNTGKVVIPLEYGFMGYMSDGLISVRKDKKYGFIDRNNKLVIPAVYSNTSNFRNGLAPVTFSDTTNYGYINKENVFAIPQQYVYADNFYEGYATVYKTKSYYGRTGKADNEIGVIDTKGKMVIEPVYDYVSLKMKGGFFSVRKKDKYGLVDSTGNIILAINYKKVGDFNDNGLAIVQEFGGISGMINTKGEFVLKPEYSELYNSYTANNIIAKRDGKYMLYDDKLKILIQPDTARRIVNEKNHNLFVFDNMVKIFDASGKLIKTIMQDKLDIYGVKFTGDQKDSLKIPYFSTMAIIDLQTMGVNKIPGNDLGDYNEEGIFPLKDLYYYFYNYTGKKLSSKKFENVINFSEGVAAVQENTYSAAYLIDKNFNKIKDLSYTFYGPYSEGLALTKGQYDGNLYYIDKTGQTVFGIKGKDGGTCENGKIMIKNSNDAYFFVNKAGKPLTNETYEALGVFSSGLAGFKSEGKFGYMDTLGNEVIAPKFDGVTDFTDGAALVLTGKDYYLINKKGQPINADKYIEASGGANSTFPVKKSTGWGLINSKGIKIIDFKYDAITPKYNDIIWASKNNKWGAMNSAGVPVTAFEFDNVENFNNGYAKVQKGKKLGLINKAGKLILPFNYDKLSSVYKNTIVTYQPAGDKIISIK